MRCRQEWEKVGEVVGGPAQSDTLDVPSKWHNGEQYDFVVDVDFEEGVPPKKLAFNRSDNPYNVAERFGICSLLVFRGCLVGQFARHEECSVSRPCTHLCIIVLERLQVQQKLQQSPHVCLHRFLAQEGLPLTYRQQVVDYILNLMGRSSALPAAATSNVDPFTGSGAYVPGASAFPAPGTASHSSNPFISEPAAA